MITVIFLGFDVGLMSYTIAFILLLFRVSDEKKSVSSIPWGTLLMISGINMLMSLVIGLGGIDLLAEGLATLMTPKTAPGVMGLTAGMSPISTGGSIGGVVVIALFVTTGIYDLFL